MLRPLPTFKGRNSHPRLLWTKYSRHRPLEGKLLNITISHEHDRWWVSCCCETTKDVIGQVIPAVVDKSEIVGIDLGLKTFAVPSEGPEIPTPRFYRDKEEKIKKLQRTLAKKQRKTNRDTKRKENSKNREKARKKLNAVHFKIANQRKGFHIEVAASIAKKYKIICIEDLNIAGMIKNHKLAKSIQDQAWGAFINELTYQAKKKGHLVIKIGRWDPSTKTCSRCGAVRYITLNERTYICGDCELEMDRDLNASLNIKEFGIQKAIADYGIQITDRLWTDRICYIEIIKPGDSDAYNGISVRPDISCASMTQEYLAIELEKLAGEDRK